MVTELKAKVFRKLIVLLAVCGLASMASAETRTWKGQPIEYTGASLVEEDANGNLVLTYTSTSGSNTLTVPSDATADILAVGGGGGGGSFNNNMDYSAGGRGGNGTVIIRLCIGAQLGS